MVCLISYIDTFKLLAYNLYEDALINVYLFNLLKYNIKVKDDMSMQLRM